MLATSRLLLRPWRESDRAPFAAMNADPLVMRYFPGLLTRAESDALIVHFSDHYSRHGFSCFALELRDTGEFIGFTGLTHPTFSAPFTPCVEIGWRIASGQWNHGYATEAARECLRFAFADLKLDEVVSFTVPANTASRRVMEKLGMSRDPADDFEHPRLASGHPLRRHALYRVRPK